jgi:hypothetical protein
MKILIVEDVKERKKIETSMEKTLKELTIIKKTQMKPVNSLRASSTKAHQWLN